MGIKGKIREIFGSSGLLSKRLQGFEYRENQISMAMAVTDSLTDGTPLLVEAPTGIGKTLAYLIPAILSGKKIVISTGTKNLQDQVFEKDIPFLLKHFNSELKVICFKGRRNYLCLRKFATFLRERRILIPGGRDVYKKAGEWAKKTKTGDRTEIDWLPDDSALWLEISSSSEQCVGQKCKFFQDCFITKMRQEAAAADMLIVNHHLYFADLALRQEEYGAVLPNHEAVIFDEAHQLDSIASQYFGLELSNFRFQELVRDIKQELNAARKGQSGDVHSELDTLEIESRKFFHGFRKAFGRISLDEVPEFADLFSQAKKIDAILNATGASLSPYEDSNAGLSSCCRRIENLRSVLELIMSQSDPEMIYWYESRPRGIFLHATPIVVAPYLERLLFGRIGPVVLTSATLSTGNDFSFIKQCLGLPADTHEMILASHFDFKKNLLIYVPGQFPQPSSPQFIAFLVEKIHELTALSKGRALVLFTSYKNMTQTYEKLKAVGLPYHLLLQGEKPKRTLLQVFKEDVHSILFATGSFWEGVDVPGPALSCVIIDKLPFDVPSDPVLKARLKEVQEDGRDPFWDYQVPQATLNLKQGVGRLIRTVDDRGIVAILDVRIWKKNYGEKFLRSLPSGGITKTMKDVENFFNFDDSLIPSQNG